LALHARVEVDPLRARVAVRKTIIRRELRLHGRELRLHAELMAAIVIAAVVAAEAQPRARIGREADAIADEPARRAREHDLDRDHVVLRLRLERTDVDLAEIAAVDERDV